MSNFELRRCSCGVDHLNFDELTIEINSIGNIEYNCINCSNQAFTLSELNTNLKTDKKELMNLCGNSKYSVIGQ